MRKPGGEARADRDRDREDREEGGDDLSLPPIPFFTSGGSSDSTTAPTSQNQLVTRPPHHSRGSALSAPSRRNVERDDIGIELEIGRARGRSAE